MKKNSLYKYNNFEFPIIDIAKTGQRIKEICTRQGYTVKKLQETLQIGARQSIYDWYNGKTLPSLDNMLALSRLLGLPVEDFVVCKNIKNSYSAMLHNFEDSNRASVYYCLMLRTLL